MPSLGMGESSFTLDNESIDNEITKTSAGNYSLGYRKKGGGKFIVKYVGRSDTDLAGRLKQWARKKEQPLFKYRYATSAKDAFEKECNNFHDFNMEEDGQIHPDKPDDSDWKCPICGDDE